MAEQMGPRFRGVTVTKQAIEGLMETIRNLYLADEIPWVIGYSGGKDSTATLQLVWMAIENLPVEQRTKIIHVINTDTLVESPVVAKWAQDSLRRMNDAAAQEQLPLETHRLTPEANQTFWVNLLGRGYPFPRKKYRWCTDRLKIQPVNKFIKEKIAQHGEVILVLGTRKAESANRAKTMAYYEKKRVRELLSPNPTLANELVFSPLAEWTDDDVWFFLMQYKNPWGYSNQDLVTLYRGATADNECPLIDNQDLPTCGKSRFGCWVCTMVEKDKSMEAMITNDDEKAWMTPLLEFRNTFGDETKDRDRRSFRKMGGFLQGTYGQLHHGPYLQKYRKDWLRRLLEIQVEINTNGPEEFSDLELITLPELRAIRRIWVFDKHEFEDCLPKLYREVTGREFEDPEWMALPAFGEDEWNILETLCEQEQKKTGDELLFEMMYGLIDIENQLDSLNQRKGILDSLQSCISHTFYRDELDALQYYQERISRKKTLGGKFDEKFFTHIQDAGDEFTQEIPGDEGEE